MRKEKKYHYIYKTTNVINGKYYIGMHSTNNLDDGYLGSGKYLWNSINYHGRDYHVKEVLEFVDSRKELKVREEEIVNEQLVNEALCMNLKTGGQGGLVNEEHHRKMREGSSKHLLERWDNSSEEEKNKVKTLLLVNLKKSHTEGKIKYDTFKGKKHSDETKKKMSETMKGKGIGESNSQFGKCWITNGEENMKIFKGDKVLEGWELGRVIKIK